MVGCGCTVYQGKSSLHHHLENMFLVFPGILSKSKLLSASSGTKALVDSTRGGWLSWRCLRWKGFSLQALSWVFWKITRTFCPKFIIHITLSSFNSRHRVVVVNGHIRQPTGGSGVITCSGSSEDAFAGSRGRTGKWVKKLEECDIVDGRPWKTGDESPFKCGVFF